MEPDREWVTATGKREREKRVVPPLTLATSELCQTGLVQFLKANISRIIDFQLFY